MNRAGYLIFSPSFFFFFFTSLPDDHSSTFAADESRARCWPDGTSWLRRAASPAPFCSDGRASARPPCWSRNCRNTERAQGQAAIPNWPTCDPIERCTGIERDSDVDAPRLLNEASSCEGDESLRGQLPIPRRLAPTEPEQVWKSLIKLEQDKL